MQVGYQFGAAAQEMRSRAEQTNGLGRQLIIYVDVVLEPGEGLVWEIEPIPEVYGREILNF